MCNVEMHKRLKEGFCKLLRFYGGQLKTVANTLEAQCQFGHKHFGSKTTVLWVVEVVLIIEFTKTQPLCAFMSICFQ